MPKFMRNASLAGLGLAFALGGAALAQPSPPPPPGPPQGQHHGPEAGWGPGRMHGELRQFARVDASLAYIRTALVITEAQAPQWNAFAAATKAAVEKLRQGMVAQFAPPPPPAAAPPPPPAPGAGPPPPPRHQPLAAPAALERHIALMSVRLEAARAVGAALAPLYAALSDEQKRTADELLLEHIPGLHGRGR